jgi:hypothetical protein
MPIRFWLIQLSAPIAGKRETFYAVVLPNGSIVEPTARRSVATVALIDRDPIIPFVDPAATAAPNNLEIHGEISFTYGFEKGSGCANRYLNPAWDSPAWFPGHRALRVRPSCCFCSSSTRSITCSRTASRRATIEKSTIQNFFSSKFSVLVIGQYGALPPGTRIRISIPEFSS